MHRSFLAFPIMVLGCMAATAQQEVCIDDAWMTARAMIAHNDSSFAQGLMTTLKPADDASVYSLQWPLIAAETTWHTGDRALGQTFNPAQYIELVERYETRLTERGLLNATGLVNWPETLREGFDYESAAAGESSVLNAYYFGALNGFGRLNVGIGRVARPFTYRARLIEQAFHEYLIDASTGLVKDAPESTTASIHANAIAAAFGLIPETSRAAVANHLLAYGLDTHPYLQPYVIEGLFRLGYVEEAWSLADEYSTSGLAIDAEFLVRQYALGLTAQRAGWIAVSFAPVFSPACPRAIADEIILDTRRISVEYTPAVGARLTVAPNTPVAVYNQTGLAIMLKNSISHTLEPLTQNQRALLDATSWQDQIGAGRGVWIDVDAQMLRLIENNEAIYQARCATAANGVGSRSESLQTPSGWHVVAKRYGEDAPWGQVFKSRQPTRQIWKPGDDVAEDMVLTRVLHLDGLEPGLNKGVGVDSFERNIYIHGTNGEALIGTPSSHGCIRMLNDDVIEFFEMAPEGTKVLITAAGGGADAGGETD